MTTNSLWDGIVLWELQEQKCQQRVCQHTDVVQSTQAGWMMLILQWKMVLFKGRSALVILTAVAKIASAFQLKIVDPTSSTNFSLLIVTHATVEQTECKAKTLMSHELILRYTYFRDFANSSFHNNH